MRLTINTIAEIDELNSISVTCARNVFISCGPIAASLNPVVGHQISTDRSCRSQPRGSFHISGRETAEVNATSQQ